MHREILRAIERGALPPGTRLVEEQVAAVFGSSRERARKVLHRLVHERRLTRIENRGVFVPKPTVAEARETYEARRIVEGGVVAALCETVAEPDLDRLRIHIGAEKQALAAGDRAGFNRLSGEFHLLLAEIQGNPEIARFLRELVTRTSLFMRLYHPLPLLECSSSEHEALVAGIAARDAAAASHAVCEHLRAVEARLAAGAAQPDPVDLKRVFGRGAS
jgi:DNA-binding GntR family transcriptional regulator